MMCSLLGCLGLAVPRPSGLRAQVFPSYVFCFGAEFYCFYRILCRNTVLFLLLATLCEEMLIFVLQLLGKERKWVVVVTKEQKAAGISWTSLIISMCNKHLISRTVFS